MNRLQSMTGFSSLDGEADWGRWMWSARSVNGRGLDVRLAVPNGFEGLDARIKKAAATWFSRGNLQIGLRLDVESGQSGLSVDTGALQTLVDAFEQVHRMAPDAAAVATLMTVKGVVEHQAAGIRDLAEQDGVIAALAEQGETCLEILARARAEEGATLKQLLIEQLEQMQSLQVLARTFAAEQVSQISDRYRARIEELDQQGVVSPDRIAVEIAALAAKADIIEELDRLAAHIARGHSLLASGEPVGRTLGFLAQELNREANTLCAKSASLNLTETGLALKGIVDQFKEQAANVE